MQIKELIFEAKARIQHPEDLIFDLGSKGATSALDSLYYAATSSKNLSIKIDGSLALIAGNGPNGFVLTDKAGLNKGVFPKSPKEVYNMLYNRMPDQPGRSDYAQAVAGLFQVVKRVIPPTFKGFVQFDVLWFNTPKRVKGTFEFKPNKVVYRVPVDSELGQKISVSKYGIAIHSYFSTGNEDEPRAINDLKKFHFREVPELVILSPKLNIELPINKGLLEGIKNSKLLIKGYAKFVDEFFNDATLKANKIASLPKDMKAFLSYKATMGQDDLKNADKEFIDWVQSKPFSDSKKQNIISYIKNNQVSYEVIWSIVNHIVMLKNRLLKVLEANTKYIQASINGRSSQEGFVVDAPTGKIKLVNRPLFRADTK